MRRRKMSNRKSKRSFTRGAMQRPAINTPSMGVLMRGGIRL
jgi:hypothetical protein